MRSQKSHIPSVSDLTVDYKKLWSEGFCAHLVCNSDQGRVSGWLQTHCAAGDELRMLNLLLPSPKC